MPFRYDCERCAITLYRSGAQDKPCPVCSATMERTEWTGQRAGRARRPRQAPAGAPGPLAPARPAGP